METRGRIILISLFILTIFFTGCKKDDLFGLKEDSKSQAYYDAFNKAKKEKAQSQNASSYTCHANENENPHAHGRKITICHNGHLITISVNAVLQHFNNHSTDRLFACDGANSVAYSDIECTLKYIMAQKNLNPNSKHSLQRAFNIWIDEYFLAGRWPSAKVNCDGTTGTGGTTTDPGTGTGGTTTDPGTGTGGTTTDTTAGTGGTTTDPGTGTGGTTTDTTAGTGGTTTDPNTGTGGTATDTTPAEPTMPVCHNGAVLNEDYLTAYVYSQDGDLLIACEFAAGGISYYDVEGTLLDIIYDYGLDATAPDVMFQAFVIWYQDYYQTGNWPLATGGAGGAGDGGSGTGSDGTVIISN